MNTVITGIAAALVSAAAFMKFRNIQDSDRTVKNKHIPAAAVFLIFAVTDTATAFVTERAGISIFGRISLVFLANFIFLLGVIDFRHRRIPNVYVTAALAVRTVLIAAQGISEGRTADIFVRSLAGLAAGALITGLAYAVSGKGIGAGDVKMFAAIGYFSGVTGVADILVYSTVLCCICGILLIAFRKCRMKDSIPMAPFAYAGTVVYLIAGM